MDFQHRQCEALRGALSFLININCIKYFIESLTTAIEFSKFKILDLSKYL